MITIKHLKPKIVDVKPEIVGKLLNEELRLETQKHESIFRSKETSF